MNRIGAYQHGTGMTDLIGSGMSIARPRVSLAAALIHRQQFAPTLAPSAWALRRTPQTLITRSVVGRITPPAHQPDSYSAPAHSTARAFDARASEDVTGPTHAVEPAQDDEPAEPIHAQTQNGAYTSKAQHAAFDKTGSMIDLLA